jgi:DNA-binding NtrC family response regulator
MVGARSREELPEALEIFELPDLVSLEADLPLMLASMIDDLSPGTGITPAALNRIAATAIQRGLAPVREMLVSALAVSKDQLEVCHLPVDGSRFLSLDEILDSDKPLAALERRVLREIVELSGWRMQEAADRLGISRVTLWRKMKDLGIDRP